MEYRLISIEDGTVLGRIRFDPFRLNPTRAGREAGVESAFGGISESPVMDTADPPEDGTAAESWEDPAGDVVKGRVAEVLHDRGWAATNEGG